MLGGILGSIMGGKSMAKAANKQAKRPRPSRRDFGCFDPYMQSGLRAQGALDTIYGTSGSSRLARTGMRCGLSSRGPIYKSAFRRPWSRRRSLWRPMRQARAR